MTTDARVVVDTNVVVSALLLPRSTPRLAFDAALRCGRLLVSVDTITELDEVLRRPKFDGYIREHHRLEFLAALLREAELVDILDTVTACRDARDDKFLTVAVNGKASHVITGDADLLTMSPFSQHPHRHTAAVPRRATRWVAWCRLAGYRNRLTPPSGEGGRCRGGGEVPACPPPPRRITMPSLNRVSLQGGN